MSPRASWPQAVSPHSPWVTARAKRLVFVDTMAATSPKPGEESWAWRRARERLGRGARGAETGDGEVSEGGLKELQPLQADPVAGEA